MFEPDEPTTIGPFVVHRKLGEGAMGVVYHGYDVALDRKVALKLVRKQLLNKPAVRGRMIREAQAMARLSSPYVVQVYQVGEHREGIYVAMEYIDGQSLGEWLKSKRRPWPVVLRTLCDAGRGLAAAHAAGLVHRDFKPDNVLVDAEGRARVLDFGLVMSEGGPSVGDTDELTRSIAGGIEETMHSSGVREPVERSHLHWSVRLTQFGRAVGTPAYMSPEQHFGQSVGPLADQFSFAITAYEALYGVRPFTGDSWDSLKAQVKRGEVPPPPADSRVPGWVFRILARGLAITPEQRWPTMTAMVDALERDPRRARLRVAGVVGLLSLASGASYAAALSRTPAEVDRCAGAAQELAGAWDEQRKEDVARAFAATQASFAEDVQRRVEQRLGAYADAWVAERRAACEASHEGQTGRLVDLQVACLGRHRSRLAALVEIFAGADRSVVENAVQAVAALPSVGACGDAESLLAVAPPEDEQMAARVEQLREQLGRAQGLEGTGRYEEGLELVRKVVEEAEALGYAPLSAEAALGEGSLWMATARPAEAEAALIRAITLGIGSDMHALAAEAAARRVFALGDGLGKHGEALATVPVAEALVKRARDDDGRLAALLANNVGVEQMSLRAWDQARAGFERTIALLEAQDGAPDPLLAVTHHNLGNMYTKQGRLEEARGQYTAARELFTRIVGANHPLGAHPLAGLGDIDFKMGTYEAAERSYRQVQVLEEAAYGAEHLYLTQPLVGLGKVYARTGRPEQAQASYARVVAIADKLGAKVEYVGEALEGLGELARAAEPAKARGLFERAVEVYAAALGADAPAQANAGLQAGRLAAELGDAAGAAKWFERVVALSGADAKVRAEAAVGLARMPGESKARVCEALTAAQRSLADGDPLRGEVDALQSGRCAG